MNLNKTKVMFNEHVVPGPISVDSIPLEVVSDYVYLDQTFQLGRHSFERETDRWIRLDWIVFGRLRRVFMSAIPQCLKCEGAETWTLTVGLVRKFKVRGDGASYAGCLSGG